MRECSSVEGVGAVAMCPVWTLEHRSADHSGKEKARQAVFKHEYYTREAIENRRRIVEEIADIEAWARAQGFNLDF